MKAGASVAKGQLLMTVEGMKMEVRHCRIDTINVKELFLFLF